MNDTPQDIDYAGDGSAQDILGWALGKLHPDIALACSFSLEDIAIIHMMTAITPDARIFALDTGRLNEETYRCADTIRRHLNIEIEWFFPKHADVERLEREKGLFSFKNSLDERHECCHIRKVEPLSRALKGLRAWITGMRAEQSVTRSQLQKIGLDKTHNNIIKINPLADWDSVQLKQYISEHGLPYNVLYDQGYKSIGCAPCTRPVAEGEHERAGRWWWEDPQHKECGLHFQDNDQGNKIENTKN